MAFLLDQPRRWCGCQIRRALPLRRLWKFESSSRYGVSKTLCPAKHAAKWAALCLVGVLGTACDRDGQKESDAALAFQEVSSSGELALGSSQAEPFLISGWESSKESAGGREFAPSLRSGSDLLVPSVGSGAMKFTLEGRPLPDVGDVVVEALVADHLIGAESLPASGGVVGFDIPEALVKLGSTRVTLRYETSAEKTFQRSAPIVAWRGLDYEFAKASGGGSDDSDRSSRFLGLWGGTEDPSSALDLEMDSGLQGGPALAANVPSSKELLEASVAPCSAADPSGAELPNVVLYVIDTLRADRVGVYGNQRGLTPVMDQLAEKSLLLERAVAQSPWTRPSVVSLFTGLTPLRHGVSGRKSSLDGKFLTLAEVLSAQGYATAGFVTNPNVSGKFGLRQGFDSYSSVRGGRGSAFVVNEFTRKWLQQRDAARPFFLYLHTVEPHAPYQPSPHFVAKFASAVSDPERYDRQFMRQLKRKKVEEVEFAREEMELLYDAEVAENDAGLGELLEDLDSLTDAGFSNTVVIVVSDHGEEFLEHGRWEHGKSLHTELIDIPFIIHLPGCAPARVSRVSQHADLLPTLMDYLGLPPLPDLDGESLLCRQCVPRAAVSHVAIDSFYGVSLTTDRLRFIDPVGASMAGESQLFDTALDPLELENALDSYPISALYFANRLSEVSRMESVAPEIDDADLDPEMVKRLRALGYIE